MKNRPKRLRMARPPTPKRPNTTKLHPNKTHTRTTRARSHTRKIRREPNTVQKSLSKTLKQK